MGQRKMQIEMQRGWDQRQDAFTRHQYPVIDISDQNRTESYGNGTIRWTIKKLPDGYIRGIMSTKEKFDEMFVETDFRNDTVIYTILHGSMPKQEIKFRVRETEKLERWVTTRFVRYDMIDTKIQNDTNKKILGEAIKSKIDEFIRALDGTVLNQHVTINGEEMTIKEAVIREDAYEELSIFMYDAIKALRAQQTNNFARRVEAILKAFDTIV